MRVAALISGGKDSALALNRALHAGHEAKFLVTMLPKREDSWMFHFPNTHLTTLFAEAAAIPLITGQTEGVKEKELADLRRILAPLEVEGIVSGAIASQYQKQRIDKICGELGFASITPLWGDDPLNLLRELVDQKFRAIITGVYAYGFDDNWLGRELNVDTINSLLDLHRRHHISIIGEGGEYETLVLDAPFFQKRIELTETEKTWKDQSGNLRVKRAHLTGK
jgi:ABC transporter with metal-binding/Fe-S-binding domain ATP-binding protein